MPCAARLFLNYHRHRAERPGGLGQSKAPSYPDSMPSGASWPRISIVTPSLNQGQFIEETIRSILLQGYPDLEYILIDGESTDGSIEIIRKYERWITHWESRSDRGQADAINKGLNVSSGVYFNWINSDDLLLPHALESVAIAGKGERSVGGAVLNFVEGEVAESLVANRGLSAKQLIEGSPETSFHQPGLWLLRKKIEECRGIDENSSLHI